MADNKILLYLLQEKCGKRKQAIKKVFTSQEKTPKERDKMLLK